MDTKTIVELILGLILAALTGSVNLNVRAFAKKQDEMATDLRALTATAGSHTTDIALLKQSVADVKEDVAQIAGRERDCPARARAIREVPA